MANYGETAYVNLKGDTAASDTTTESDYQRGYNEGWSTGYDDAKAEILLNIIKGVLNG